MSWEVTSSLWSFPGNWSILLHRGPCRFTVTAAWGDQDGLGIRKASTWLEGQGFQPCSAGPASGRAGGRRLSLVTGHRSRARPPNSHSATFTPLPRVSGAPVWAGEVALPRLPRVARAVVPGGVWSQAGPRGPDLPAHTEPLSSGDCREGSLSPTASSRALQGFSEKQSPCAKVQRQSTSLLGGTPLWPFTPGGGLQGGRR